MMTGGDDIAQLAQMLRQFGRGKDKILAHITPEEAAKLKRMGGSGTINPVTGLPEFQEEDYLAQARAAEPPGYYGTTQTGFNNALDAVSSNMPLTDRMRYDTNFAEDQPSFRYTGSDPDSFYRALQYTPEFFNQTTSGGSPTVNYPQPGFNPPDALYEMQMADQEAAAPSAAGGRQVAPVEENLFGRAERGLTNLRAAIDRYPNLSRLAAGGASVLGQALLARRAQRQGEAQAARYREMSAPFRAAEQEALSRARGGGLSPTQARELERTQAIARQDLSARNLGTGSAASGILAGQAQRTRSVGRQQSLDEALQLAGIADRYERAAIQQELAADQELANLFASVVGSEIQRASQTQAQPRRG